MKHAFYVDVRHLPYQTLINVLFYLKLYNILVFKENKLFEQKCNIWHQIRVKIAEYDYKMQIFIILNQNKKFYNSPKIAEFLKNIAFST